MTINSTAQHNTKLGPNISFHIISNLCALKTSLFVVLSEQLLAELNVLGLGVLLAQPGVDLLLPLVVLSLALASVLACLCVVCLRRHRGAARARGTYSEVEHAGLLGGSKVLALGDLGVGVELRVVLAEGS
jgi:hypothetical protein